MLKAPRAGTTAAAGAGGADRLEGPSGPVRALPGARITPVPMGSLALWRSAPNAEEFLAVCDRQPVRGIVWGISPGADQNRNGVRLMSTPSTCAQFSPLETFALDELPRYRGSIQGRCQHRYFSGLGGVMSCPVLFTAHVC